MPPKKRDYANKITDLQPQKSNANKHKEHGERLLRKSVQDYGLADGITVAANNEAISGSLRIETLADVMPDVKIQVVETYGDTLLVNKRMDIPSPDTKQGRALSVASNQVAYTDYNPDGDLLKEWGDEDADIRKLFADSEWRELTGEEILPTLDKLQAQYGETQDRDFWPIIKIQVSPETYQKYNTLMRDMVGVDDADKFDALISRGN